MLNPIDIRGPGEYLMEIVGESHYQEALSTICGGRIEGGHNLKVAALLICDDKNPYDNKAIRIEIKGETVGHLDRERAREYRKKLTQADLLGRTVVCPAIIEGGGAKGSWSAFGVRLDIGINPFNRKVHIIDF